MKTILATTLALLLASSAYAYDGKACRVPNHGGPIVCGPSAPSADVVTCPKGFILDPFRSDPLAPCLPIPEAPETDAGERLPVEKSGTGDNGVGPLYLNAGLLRVNLTHNGTSNFAVVLYSASGERIGLLVNEIGAYSGTVAQQISAEGVHYFDIQADGDWVFKAK